MISHLSFEKGSSLVLTATGATRLIDDRLVVAADCEADQEECQDEADNNDDNEFIGHYPKVEARGGFLAICICHDEICGVAAKQQFVADDRLIEW